MKTNFKPSNVSVTRLVELETPIAPVFLNGATPEALAAHAWLYPRFVTARGNLRMSIHTFLVEWRGGRLVVDTCIGNDRPPSVDRRNRPRDAVSRRSGEGRLDARERDGRRVYAPSRLIPTPGHTPGHVSVMIESAGSRAVITGDMTHHPCQPAHPEWSSATDTDPRASEAMRRERFAQWPGERILVLGTHYAPPTAGYIVRDGPSFRFRSRRFDHIGSPNDYTAHERRADRSPGRVSFICRIFDERCRNRPVRRGARKSSCT